MKILSIETSCDDTALTIFEVKGGIQNANFKILANASNSQIKIHTKYGGVYPMLAKREHIKNLPILLEEVLKKSKLNKKQRPVEAIAVTYGPGLPPSLWAGIVFAKELAEKWKVPLIPVNHMEGHVLSVFGKDKGKFTIPKVKTPILSLLVSGGHTQLVLSKKWMQYEIIGESLDDAVGEAFDKVARMLDLPYPGGPHISKLAEKLRIESKQIFQGLRRATARGRSEFFSRKIATLKNFPALALPRPMLYSKNFDFSFSGLKTAVLYLIRDLGQIDQKKKAEIALEFENAAIECLIYKTRKAIEKYKVKTVIVAGGVAANKHLRNEMKKIMDKDMKLLFPTPLLSTDNSIMIGIAGYLNYIKNKKKVPKLDSIKATGKLRLQ
ncbi:tRNA (adenosine(37)-N6)-threonylcarbamoyltransferase complex transferase subunit TsaD [Candidatus Nomurabacteria bacterium]|nr:tRNA (adenosine(37)-N6)-threonylcarbamoyltransferase complex transferase subunit TsaD [Candidatus Nomurabacteria bacterium]